MATKPKSAKDKAIAPVPYPVRAFTPVHPDLKNAAGVPAKLANEAYVESLGRIVYYWGYPAVDAFGRTSGWELMKKAGPGATMGLFPGAPKNKMGYLDDYMPPSQRKVVTPNNDTIYGVGFADTARRTSCDSDSFRRSEGPLLDDPDRATVYQRNPAVGIGVGTPGGKSLLVGPDWQGKRRKASSK